MTKRTPEEALRRATEALGGLQDVGSSLRTDIDPKLRALMNAAHVNTEGMA